MMKKLFIGSILCAVALAGCGQDTETAENKVNSPIQTAHAEAPMTTSSSVVKPKYRVAAEIDAPFILKGDKGNVSGFDHDLLMEIAKRQGFELEFTPYPWSSLFTAIEKGEMDMTAGGIYITPERQAKFDFSHAYLETGTSFLQPKESLLRQFGDMRGKKVAVKEKTQAEKATHQALGNTAQVQRHDTLWLAAKDVFAKHADVAVGDTASLRYFVAQHPEFNMEVFSDTGLPKEQYAFLVRKGNPELLAKLNQGLAEVKADGTYTQLYQKWFEGNK